MPTDQEKQEIRRLAQQGKSVNHITKKLQLPKSTVYYHFRKQIGQKQKENSLTLPTNPETTGEICGTFAGDGNYYYEKKNYKYRITYTLNINQSYWKKLVQLLEDSFNKKPHVIPQEEYNRVRVRYESKTLYNFLKRYLTWDKVDKTSTIDVRTNEVSDKFKIGFIRGLVDTDGHKTQYGSYRIGTISQPLMTTTQTFLRDLHIESSLKLRIDNRENCRDMYRLSITGENSDKFGKKIRPRHPKKAYTETK